MPVKLQPKADGGAEVHQQLQRGAPTSVKLNSTICHPKASPNSAAKLFLLLLLFALVAWGADNKPVERQEACCVALLPTASLLLEPPVLLVLLLLLLMPLLPLLPLLLPLG